MSNICSYLSESDVNGYLTVLIIRKYPGVLSVSRCLVVSQPVLPAKCVSICRHAELGLDTPSLAEQACRMYT